MTTMSEAMKAAGIQAPETTNISQKEGVERHIRKGPFRSFGPNKGKKTENNTVSTDTEKSGLPNSIENSRIAKSASATDMTLDEWMASICPFIDFDSARFSELIWARRSHAGLSTVSRLVQFSHNSTASKEAIFDILRKRFHIHYESNFTFRAYQEDRNRKGILSLYIVAGGSSNGPVLVVTGDRQRVDSICNFIQARFKEPVVMNVERLTNFSEQGPITQNIEFIEGRIGKVGHEDFYPFLFVVNPETGDKERFDFKKFADGYKEGSNVLLLIGPPGTGKSVWIKRILMELNFKKNGIANGNNTTMDPRFIEWLKGYERDSVVGIEDAHKLIEKREDGNEQMSNILNYAEGITSANNKLIISTNLPHTGMVDDALIRDGRCHAILEFRPLKGQEINVARAAIGLPDIDIEENTSLVLAEALNTQKHRVKNKPTSRGGLGFTN